MLIGGENVSQLCELYRCVWISGRPGGYKTSLAFEMSKKWLDRGYKLITNCETPWADDLKSLEPDNQGKLNAVVILDEAGLEVKFKNQIESVLAFSRKMNIILLMPSFHPPVRTSQIVNIQAMFNFKQIGLPIIAYKWRVKLGMYSDQGLMFWLDPSSVYGVYSTLSPGDYITEVYEFLINEKEDYKKRYGYERKDGLSDLEESQSDGQQALVDAIESLSGDISDFVSLPRRKGRRR